MKIYMSDFFSVAQ